ncbi:hypothetical protein SCB49_01507 [unidentified eubacterium SCB49]|nr:hypothetical protein SCB49_01507 [unidentified eubacterium SCB49]
MKNNKSLATGTTMGILIGVVVGIFTDNIGLWLPIGLALGAGVGNSLNKKEDK